MAFDRSKFQATKKSILKQQSEEASMPQSNNSNRADYVKILEGDNIVRWYPPHPGAKSFLCQKVTNWLPFSKKDDEGNVKTGRRPFFNPSVHSNIKDYDIVDFYRELAKKAIQDEETDAEKIKSRISELYHFKEGISTSYKWVGYGDVSNVKGSSFGRIEIANGVKYKLDALAFQEENVDEPMGDDPFTHPDTGFSTKISFKKKDEEGKLMKGDKMYTVSFNTKNYVPQSVPLTDDQLEAFSKMDSLESMFEDVFTRETLDGILEGLEIFDQEKGYGIFATTEFSEYVEKIYNLYPSKEEKQKEETVAKAAEPDPLPWDKQESEPEPAAAPPSQRHSREDLKAKLAKLKGEVQLKI